MAKPTFFDSKTAIALGAADHPGQGALLYLHTETARARSAKLVTSNSGMARTANLDGPKLVGRLTVTNKWKALHAASKSKLLRWRLPLLLQPPASSSLH